MSKVVRFLGIGINEYQHFPESNLEQCVRDIGRTFNGILNHFTRSVSAQLLLNGDATAAAIVDRMQWLVGGLTPGDECVLHNSCHGIQWPSLDEADGYDEAIVAADYDGTDAHIVRDKVIHEILMNIPNGARLVWVDDGCYAARNKAIGLRSRMLRPPTRELRRVRAAAKKGIFPRGMCRVADEAQCVYVAACAENQTAQETDAGGALTVALWDALSKHPSWPMTRILGQVKRSVTGQTPQLMGTRDLCRRPFLPIER